MTDETMKLIEEINAFSAGVFMEKLLADEDGLHIFISGTCVGERADRQTSRAIAAAFAPGADEALTEKLGAMIEGSLPILPDASVLYEITFPVYVGYSMRDESFTSWNPDETFQMGLYFRVYETSEYLDYLSRTTFASQVIGAYTHYGVYCLNHILDVASPAEPVIVRHMTERAVDAPCTIVAEKSSAGTGGNAGGC